jgi:hypothetical protein
MTRPTRGGAPNQSRGVALERIRDPNGTSVYDAVVAVRLDRTLASPPSDDADAAPRGAMDFETSSSCPRVAPRRLAGEFLQP